MYFLTKELSFPNVADASSEGIVAIGGDLSAERLLTAYKKGIFPWFGVDEPIIWWSPNPRMVLFPEELKISKSMQQLLRKKPFRITYNQAFPQVILECAKIPRKAQEDTWITQEMVDGYTKLFELGYMISVEVWQENELVGGLYGVDLGAVFCGESMFTKVNNASKYGLVYLVKKLKKENYKLIDCQVYTSHLESLGAKEIPREVFLSYLD